MYAFFMLPLTDVLGLLPLTKIIGLILVIVSLLLLYRLSLMWIKDRVIDADDSDADIPENMSSEPRQILTKPEAVLYNLVCLAVRDSYLVLAKLPLRNLLKVTVAEKAVNNVRVRPLPNISVDFVLVHPGTLIPMKAVVLEVQNMTPEQDQEKMPLLYRLLQDANIEIIRLHMGATYTVTELTKRFGLEEEI